MKKKLLGFAFVEVLLAIAVVGIVAALTIPTLISAYQKDLMIMQLKKEYKDLEYSLTILQSDKFFNSNLYKSILNRNFVESGTVKDSAGQFLTKFYAIEQTCGTNPPQPCFAYNYKSISGKMEQFKCQDGFSVLLKDGVSICIIPATSSAENNTPAIVYIDVNGPKEPNIGGIDMFSFNIYNDFSIDEISPEDIKNNKDRSQISALCHNSTVGQGCLSKLIENNWKLNY